MRARSQQTAGAGRGFAFSSGHSTVQAAVQKRSDSCVREKSGAGRSLG